jgi:predicted O-linked N-acetylglucosamine transferase (SPINDLY family)
MKAAQRQTRAEKHWRAGLLAAEAKQWSGAAREFERAATLTPRDALMWLNLARAQLRLDRLPDATRAARRAFELQPDNPVACRALGECLVQQHRCADAVAAFEALSPEAPRDHDLLAAQGNAYFQAMRPRDAIESFFAALALKIDSPLVHYRMGLAFKDLGLASEASECFRTATALDGGGVRAMALSLLVHQSRQAADWQQIDEDTAALLKALDADDVKEGRLLSPFALLALDSTPAQQRRTGWLRASGLAQGVRLLPPPGPRAPGRVRVGYLSADFSQHATSVLMAELLERRDSSRFEVFLYSHSAQDGSPIQQRVRAACEHYLDVTHINNADVAQRMRDDALDIVIDLKGHTRDSRFELLAYRPAPVQVAYLGFPATTGAHFIDYLVGDPVVTPLAHAPQYSEHIAQLPASYQPNDRQRVLPAAASRADAGLPPHATVLCCFNQIYKITPHMLDLWVRVLSGAPDAVLWMLAWNPHARANLLKELAQRGVGAERVFFAPKLSLEGHLARLRCADLFLDTWPCNAHTTASEALWAGVPVLTVPGATFASRVAASLVAACGLPDLACASEDDYVHMAIALAREPALLQGLKQHLDTHRMELPLFDSDRYARDFEALLLRMFERQQAGLPPAALPAGLPPAALQA